MHDELAQFDDEDSLEEEMMFDFEQHFTPDACVDGQSGEMRPANPMAFVLESREYEDACRDYESIERYANAKSLGMYGEDEPPMIPFDFNGRKKRKFDAVDPEDSTQDQRCVKPRALRAKYLQYEDASCASWASPSSADAVMNLDAIKTVTPRSQSISIPSTKTNPFAFAVSRTYSPKPAPSRSWGAAASSSFEYLCRQSLDISSPLRLRFRDLMVGNAGSFTP